MLQKWPCAPVKAWRFAFVFFGGGGVRARSLHRAGLCVQACTRCATGTSWGELAAAESCRVSGALVVWYGMLCIQNSRGFIGCGDHSPLNQKRAIRSTRGLICFAEGMDGWPRAVTHSSGASANKDY